MPGDAVQAHWGPERRLTQPAWTQWRHFSLLAWRRNSSPDVDTARPEMDGWISTVLLVWMPHFLLHCCILQLQHFDFLLYLAYIQRMEENSIQKVLEAQKHHLYEGPIISQLQQPENRPLTTSSCWQTWSYTRSSLDESNIHTYLHDAANQYTQYVGLQQRSSQTDSTRW